MKSQRSPWQIQKAVVFALFMRELKNRFGKYKLGYAWLLVEPLAHVIILSILFSQVRNHSLFGIDFPVFLVTGIIPFLLFKNVALRVMDGVEANRALFSYRQIKPMDTFIARSLLDSFLALLSYALLLAGMAWIGLDVPIRDIFTLIYLFVLMLLMALGLGMVLCVVTHYMPEAKTFARIAFMPLYLLSGVIFPVTSLPPEFLDLLLWNPLLHFIELMRLAFFAQYHTVQGLSLGYVAVLTLVLLFVGLSWYRIKRFDLIAR